MKLFFKYDWADHIETDSAGDLTVVSLGDDPVLPEPDIVEALEKPFGLPPLGSVLSARGVKTVLVLVDDITRSTPQNRILPALVRYLENNGISRKDITILIATGLHRKMTDEEIRKRFSPELADSMLIINHDA